MFKYARSDTHFLLYIYDNLRNELIDRSNSSNPHLIHLEDVLARSKETALLTYEPDIYDEVSGANAIGWSTMLRRTPTNFTNEQLLVFKAIHRWRDKTARQADESLNYVMPRRILFSVARVMPVDVQSLLGLSRDMPPLVKLRASELVGVIKQAREDAGKTNFQAPNSEPAYLGKVAPRSLGAIASSQGLGRHSKTKPFGNAQASEAATIANVFSSQTADAAMRAKTNTSCFWGSVFGSSLWHPAEKTSTLNEDIRLALPLPKLTAEIFEGGAGIGQSLLVAVPETRAEHQFVKERKETEVSTAAVSEAEHKSEAGEPSVAADCDMDEAEARVAEAAQKRKDAKSERRRLRKEEKKRRKLEKEGRSEDAVRNDAEASDDLGVSVGENYQKPFDYAAAPSVLHSKTEVPDRSGPRKAFNPYAKSGDVTKGVYKSRKEVPGKSITFKR
jgi:exosome complex exonuclease RRP6